MVIWGPVYKKKQKEPAQSAKPDQLDGWHRCAKPRDHIFPEGRERKEGPDRQRCKGLIVSFLLLLSYCQLLIMNPFTQVWSKSFVLTRN